MISLKSVLVATDFSEPADIALAYGRDLARTYGATLHVLHVAENVMAMAAEYYPAVLPDFQKEIEDAASTRLEALLTSEDRKDLRARAVVRSSVPAAAAIVEYAKDERIDLIIMGTHGRGAVSRLFAGSVAERVVRTAPCPVLTVRHPEREFIAPDALATIMAKA